MNPIIQVFRERQAFIGFVVCGDGGIEYCLECCLQMIAGGVDILEIGFPFSDPIADGPVIQKAAQRALKEGTTHTTILEIAKGIRKKSTIPLTLFTYYNPLLKQGDAYLKELKTAGFDAILVVDLPPPLHQKNHPYFQALKAANLLPIFVITPSTGEDRLTQIASISQGFLYYACQKGTTGARAELPKDISFHISRIRQKTNLPIAIGFGIADKQSALSALKVADGFVVGSAFVKLMEQGIAPEELKTFVQTLDPRSKIMEMRP
jgi:tryptophan synthase alpha chain